MKTILKKALAFIPVLCFLCCIPTEVASQVLADSVAVCPPEDPDAVRAIEPDDTETPGILGIEEIAVAVDSICANYDSDWTDLSMQGKLSFDGLPMRVNVKIYMKRGESVIMSARAPILGEVVRVEICPDSMVFINKATRCYHSVSLSAYAADRRAYLADIQDILVGQMAFPGHGRLTPALAPLSQWMEMPGDNVLVYPSAPLQTPSSEYGFVLDSSSWQLRSFVLMVPAAAAVLETTYLYGDQGWTLGLTVGLRQKEMKGELQLSYPDYSPAPLDFTLLADRYRKVGFRDVLKF